MNLKRIFGTVLTILGIVGLIYAAILYVNKAEGSGDIRSLLIYGAIGLLFFAAGIGLIRTTKDES